MSFNPIIQNISSNINTSIEEVNSTTSTPLIEYSAATIQSSSSPLSGRTVAHLPADDKYRKGWEILGVKWLESLDERPFLAKALLPEGWKTDSPSPLNIDHHDIMIIDDAGHEQVKIRINAGSQVQEASVSFLRIDKKLLKQTDIEESKVIKDDFKPVCYLGYRLKFYCSYEEIISAIESWGKVEAILMANYGLNHTFIVSFKKPIRFSSYKEGIMVNLTGGGGIWHTPFELRSMNSRDSSGSSFILSNNMMAFDIRCLKTGYFCASDIWNSERLLPDKRLSQIEEEVGEPLHRKCKEIEKRIKDTFSESDKAKKLLEWIKQSGLSILERGLYRSGGDHIDQYSTDEIVESYTSRKNPWQVVMRAEE